MVQYEGSAKIIKKGDTTMKKLALILALVSLMALCVSSLTVNAAPPKLEDYFPQVAAPTDEEQINPTTWNYLTGLNQLTDPAGQWSWATTFDGKECYVGAYNAFETLSVSDTSYINAENAGISQFPSGFFA
jgi:hypothetical protein